MTKSKEELAFEAWNSKRLNNLVFTPETSEEDREFLKKKHAFISGYSAAEPKWISCKERLPELYPDKDCSRWVLVYGFHEIFLARLVRYDGHHWATQSGNSFTLEECRMWTELPAAPKEEK